jgi:nucleoprotein TPR
LSEVEKRCTELKDQNDKLHRHLEDVSAQALSIQQRANTQPSSAETGEGASATEGEDGAKSPEHQLAELRDVIRYVRREKEILECQHELNLQESRRLKQQLDQTNKSLEETRALLSEERSLKQEAIVSNELRERLTEKVNQLSVIRDSNTLLRAENQKLLRQVSALEENGRRLAAKISPLNARVNEVEAEIELRKEEQKQIGEDRDRWRTRAVEIMAKHDRIDPTEFQELKDANEKFKAEAAENTTALATLKTEQEAVQGRFDELQAKYNKLYNSAQQWRKRSLEEAAKSKTSQQEMEESKAKITQLEKALEEVNTRAGSQDQVSKRDRENVQKALDQLTKLKEKLETENKELKDNKGVIETNFETIKVMHKRLANSSFTKRSNGGRIDHCIYALTHFIALLIRPVSNSALVATNSS